MSKGNKDMNKRKIISPDMTIQYFSIYFLKKFLKILLGSEKHTRISINDFFFLLIKLNQKLGL